MMLAIMICFIYFKIANGSGGQTLQPHKNFAIYIFIYVWKQYFLFLNWYKIVTYIIMWKSSLKTGNLIINWLLLSYATERTERLPSPFDKNMKARGLQKSQFLNSLVNWGKTWKCSLGFSKIPISHLLYELGKTWQYTQRKTNISKSKFWIYGWFGKSYILKMGMKIRWGFT